MAGIDVRPAENVAEEGARLLGVPRVDECVNGVQHGHLPSDDNRPPA